MYKAHSGWVIQRCIRHMPSAFSYLPALNWHFLIRNLRFSEVHEEYKRIIQTPYQMPASHICYLDSQLLYRSNRCLLLPSFIRLSPKSKNMNCRLQNVPCKRAGRIIFSFSSSMTTINQSEQEEDEESRTRTRFQYSNADYDCELCLPRGT